MLSRRRILLLPALLLLLLGPNVPLPAARADADAPRAIAVPQSALAGAPALERRRAAAPRARRAPTGSGPILQRLTVAPTLRFNLAEPGAVMLWIVDARGRRIVSLVDATLPAGSHSVRWDGCDAAGSACASGSYWAVVRTQQGSAQYGLSLVG